MTDLAKSHSRMGLYSPKRAFSRGAVFDVKLFLESNGPRRRVAKFREKETILRQGDPGTSVIYILEGVVKLTVVNRTGKEAIVTILGPGDFFGIRALTGSVYTSTATVMIPTIVLIIEKEEMARVLHKEHAFSDVFIANMLALSSRGEKALIDQLFNSSEKRLARTLLLLARYGTQDQPQELIPKLTQEMLAEMIGTTRSRISVFINKFRKLGFISLNGGIHVNKSLLSVVLHD